MDKFAFLDDELNTARGMILFGLSALEPTKQNVGNINPALHGLTQGIERLLKVIILLRYYRKNNKFPNVGYLRDNYNHKIRAMFEEVYRDYLPEELDDEIKEFIERIEGDEYFWRILDIFEDFADNHGRYYNLSQVLDASNTKFCGWEVG